MTAQTPADKKPWFPVVHLSNTRTGGGSAACGNRRAHMTTSKENFAKEPIADRCELCQRIYRSRGGV